MSRKSVILVIFNTQTVFKLVFYHSLGTSLPSCEKVLNGFVYTLNVTFLIVMILLLIDLLEFVIDLVYLCFIYQCYRINKLFHFIQYKATWILLSFYINSKRQRGAKRLAKRALHVEMLSIVGESEYIPRDVIHAFPSCTLMTLMYDDDDFVINVFRRQGCLHLGQGHGPIVSSRHRI